jgi:hypothetical protein
MNLARVYVDNGNEFRALLHVNVNESSVLRFSGVTARMWGNNESMRVVEYRSLENQERDGRAVYSIGVCIMAECQISWFGGLGFIDGEAVNRLQHNGNYMYHLL